MSAFKDKIVLVTGASRGIGREAAVAFAREGAHVVALARTAGGLEELDDEIRRAGGAATLIPADLCDAEAMRRLAPALAARFGRLDVLVANAGALGELAPVADISESAWRRAFDVNVDANWRLLVALDPLLRAAKAARVVALTSRVGGELARPFWAAYAASKAALEMLMKTYAEEVAATAIRVALVDPGATRTRMRAEAMPGEDPLSLPGPETIAPLILKAADASYDGMAQKFRARDLQ
jgi:NAD(P)-dependent dehydrogenase (short-subunit alcohol dehydrogenase family)